MQGNEAQNQKDKNKTKQNTTDSQTADLAKTPGNGKAASREIMCTGWWIGGLFSTQRDPVHDWGVIKIKKLNG